MVAGKFVVFLLIFSVLSAAAHVLSEDEDDDIIAGRSQGKRVHVEEDSLDFDRETIKWLRKYFDSELAYTVVEFCFYMGFFISYMAFFWFCCFSRCAKKDIKCPECPETKNIAKLPA